MRITQAIKGLDGKDALTSVFRGVVFLFKWQSYFPLIFARIVD